MMPTFQEPLSDRRLLPGIEWEERLVDPLAEPAPGELFRVRDGRGFPKAPILRYARLLPPPPTSGPDWTAPVRRRLRELVNAEYPFVLRPTEVMAQPDGSLCVLEPYWTTSLDRKMTASQGISCRMEAMEWLEQILTALAALHDRDLPHGDLRAANIVLLPDQPQQSKYSAWLANTAWGGLTFWSEGLFVANEVPSPRPPEENGRASPPTPRRDLFALGRLASQLAHGRDARPVPSAGLGWFQHGRDVLRHWLRDDELEGLSWKLLRDKEERPVNARNALRWFRRWRIWVRWRTICCAAVMLTGVLLAIISLLGFCLGSLQKELQTVHGNLSQAQALLTTKVEAIDKLAADLTDKDAALREKDGEVVRLIELIVALGGDPHPTSPSELARRVWQNHRARLVNAVGELDTDAFQQALQTIPSAEGRSVFQEWGRTIFQRQTRIQLWRQRDAELESLERAVVNAPWDVANSKALERRLEDLTTAAKTWWTLAHNTTLPAEKLDLHIGREEPAVQQILNGWLRQIEARQSWEIDWKTGTAPAGHGTDRAISVYGEDWSPENWHAWSAETAEDYAAKGVMTPFRWTLGSPLIMALEADRSWWRAGYRPYRLYHEFSGPLAIWLAHSKGQVNQDGFSLEFDIVDCPGPPRSITSQLPAGL